MPMRSSARPSAKRVAAIIKEFQNAGEFANASQYRLLHEEPL